MRTRSGSKLRGRGGYTLTELAVVIAAIAILMAMGIPSFWRYQRSTAVRNAHRQLVLDLRLARQRALAEHHSFVVVIDSGPPAVYGVFADRDEDLVKDPGEDWLVERTLPAGMGIDGSSLVPPDSLAFTRAGALPAPWPGGTVSVGWTGGGGGGGGRRTLRAWPSGAIEVLEP